MTKFSNHPHNKSHGIAHSQSGGHHSATKSVTHRSPGLALASAHQQQKLLAQQLKSKNSAVKTFKTPEGSLMSIGGALGGGGLSGALAGLIPPSTTTGGASLSLSLLDRFKSASTPTHTKKSIREAVFDKIRNLLGTHRGALGVHCVVGFNAIQRVLETRRTHASVLLIAKDAKDELVRLLIKIATQQGLPFVVLPSFSQMLKDAVQLKKAFCLLVRSDAGVKHALQEREKLRQTTANNKKEKSKKDKNKTAEKEENASETVAHNNTKEDAKEEEIGLSIDTVTTKTPESNVKAEDSPKDTREMELESEALEAALDELRDYLLTLAEGTNPNQ